MKPEVRRKAIELARKKFPEPVIYASGTVDPRYTAPEAKSDEEASPEA
jgi:hypothetical protein